MPAALKGVTAVPASAVAVVAVNSVFSVGCA